MNTMEDKFRKAIKEHLPEQVGDELKELITEHGRLKRDGKAKDEQIEHLEKAGKEMNERLDEHATIDEREAAVAVREKDVESKEIRLDCHELMVRLDAANEKARAFEGFMQNIARNVDYRRHFFGEVPVGYKQPTKDNYGNEMSPGMVETAHVDQTTEETVE